MRANLSRCEDASAISFNDSSFRYSSFNFPDVTRLHQVFTFEQYNKKNVNTARSDVKRVLAFICRDFFYADRSILQITILHIDNKHF